MKRIFCLLFCAVGIAAAAQPSYKPAPEMLQVRKQFEADRFGIFIHWGIYSMLGQGEWVMQNKNIDYQEYARLADGFYPSRFDAREWVKAFKAAGAKYVTVTSRHHDGFSMFRSAASAYNVVDATPWHRDVIGELAEACREEGLALHLYYSHVDWGRPDYPRGRTGAGTGRPDQQDWRSYMDFVNAQLTELLTQYGPVRAIWFDGVWDQNKYGREKQVQIWNLDEQYALIHHLQKTCMVANNHHLATFPGEDMQIFERDQPGMNESGYSGQEISALPLETCQTMNDSWGYNICDNNYKSADYLIRYLVETAARGGNLLLNVGPRPDGSIPEEALERLQAMGGWLEVYGESVYGTAKGKISAQPWGVTTTKGRVLYAHVFDSSNTVSFKCGAKLLKAEMLNGGKPVKFKQKKGVVTLDVPQAPAGVVDQVVKLSFKTAL